MSGVLSGLRQTAKFESFKDAEQFEATIARLVAEGDIEEVPVEEAEHPMLEEHWYKDIGSGEIWRYCPPEFPDRGVWTKVQ